MMRTNKKGFTIAELLIVVAIIAVLVAIAIPVFGTLLERSREATDAANIRNSYAEAVSELLNNNLQSASGATAYTVQQKNALWTSKPDFTGPLADALNVDFTKSTSIQLTVKYSGSGEIAVSSWGK